ncbi:MAG: DUF664 domain-containing protein [Alkalicoccus sp.]|nr:MAG: DUF664 domain-containing protein [Alkalicoccus sp.]
MLDFRIIQQEGYDEKIGELVSMLEYTRQMTLYETADLSRNELEYLQDESSNSIGALLLHMAAIEFVHQIISFEKRDLTKEEYEEWGPALELGEKGREKLKNYPPDYYFTMLEKVRKKTLALLRNKEDNWLYEEDSWDNGIPYNNHFLWFHGIEDETSHRGQIKTLKRKWEQKA